jgi:nucleoside permease NupC
MLLRLVSLCGIGVMLALCFAFSHERRAIRWRLVGTGMALQALLGNHKCSTNIVSPKLPAQSCP